MDDNLGFGIILIFLAVAQLYCLKTAEKEEENRSDYLRLVRVLSGFVIVAGIIIGC